jgi:hypothetical protein
MQKDLKGDKQPADIGGTATHVDRITKGDGDGKPAEALIGDKDEEAGGAARAKAPTSARRKEIDKAAASPRWEG